MAISKIILNGVTQMDLTADTVAASNLIAPNTAHGADGQAIVGTASGGGSSAWTKVAETSYQVNTTNTSTATIETWATGSSDLWTSSKWVYVRVRDTAGKRNGYYYGGDQFFYNYLPINGSSSTYTSSGLSICIRYSGTEFAVTVGSYGVYADRVYNDGSIRVRQRYSSTNSLTINGTYKVEVYLLDPAGGVPIFE